MIINKSGIAIRMAVADLRVMGRATQGVRLIKVRGEDSIAAVAKVMSEDEEVILDEDGNPIVESTESAESEDHGTSLDNDDTETQTEE